VFGALQNHKGARRAQFVVETLNQDLEPESWWLHGRLSGSTDELFSVETDGAGRAVISSQNVSWDPASGVAWTLEIQAAWRDVGGCGKIPVRPLGFTRIDELSFQLAFNLGAGLGSRGLLMAVDASAAGQLVSSKKYVQTYVHRPIGTGMAESSLIAVFDESHLQAHDLLDRSMILRTFGTGMAESSIIFDDGFFHPNLLAEYGTRDLLVRGELSGTGMAESSIVLDDGSMLPWDHYFQGFGTDRRILWMNHGTGQGSAALVFDGGLLHPALFEDSVGGIDLDMASTAALIGGAGMAESSRVVDFSEAHVSHLGFDYDALASWFVTGTGMAESSLVLDGGFAASFAGPLWTWLGGMGMAESSLVASWSPVHMWTLTVADWTPESMATTTMEVTGVGQTPLE
jgi:hypothetical protein